MQARVKSISMKHGLEEPPPEVAALLIHAVHERLKNIVEKLAVIAQHRIDLSIKVQCTNKAISIFCQRNLGLLHFSNSLLLKIEKNYNLQKSLKEVKFCYIITILMLEGKNK